MTSIEDNKSIAADVQREADVLDAAGILGVTPDEAADMSTSEIASAFVALKVQENDRSVNADLLTDAARIA
jgi:hypothetical protein